MDVTHTYTISLSFWLVLIKSGHSECILFAIPFCFAKDLIPTSPILYWYFSLWDAYPLPMKTFLYTSYLGKKYKFTNVKLPPFSLFPNTAKFSKVSTRHLFLIMLHHRSSAYGWLAFSHWNCTCQGLKNFSVAEFCRHFSVLTLLYTQEHLA